MSLSNSYLPYFGNNEVIESQIAQLQLTSAIAPNVQTQDHIATWATSATGPSSDHNLLVNNPVILDTSGNLKSVHSESFTAVASDPNTGSLWLNTSNNHLYHGAVDLEATGGNVVSIAVSTKVNELASYSDSSGTVIQNSNILAFQDTDSESLYINAAAYVGDEGGNTMIGYNAGGPGTWGGANTTAVGCFPLSNISAGTNTAVGALCALGTTITDSTIMGSFAGSDAQHNGSVIIGDSAAASSNTASVSTSSVIIGSNASNNNYTSLNNAIVIGHTAGQSYTGNLVNSILLGNYGSLLSGATETGFMLLGDDGVHTTTIIAGVRGTTTVNVDAIPVVVDSSGQFGTVSSSAKYKRNIEPLQNSDIIYKLTPMQFHMKNRDDKLQMGLIAEDVEKVYPEMCIYQNSELLTVDYQRLTILLLDQIQKLKRDLADTKTVIRSVIKTSL